MKTLLPVVLALILFIGFGCGKNQEPAGEQQKTTSENKSENKTPENTGDVKKDTSKTGGNELGMKTGLPADYPKDVPVPPNSTCHGSIYNQSEGTTVTFVSKDKPMNIVNFFKTEMSKNGFTQEQGADDMVNDKGGMLKWNKDKRMVEIMMSFKSETSETDIVLSYKDSK